VPLGFTKISTIKTEEAKRMILVDTSVCIEIFRDKSGNIAKPFGKISRVRTLCRADLNYDKFHESIIALNLKT
jgi:hypothetical protein